MTANHILAAAKRMAKVYASVEKRADLSPEEKAKARAVARRRFMDEIEEHRVMLQR